MPVPVHGSMVNQCYILLLQSNIDVVGEAFTIEILEAKYGHVEDPWYYY